MRGARVGLAIGLVALVVVGFLVGLSIMTSILPPSSPGVSTLPTSADTSVAPTVPPSSVGSAGTPAATTLSSSEPTDSPEPSASGPTLGQLIGQKLVVRIDGGATPSADLLGRIRRGEVGGVILFARNVKTTAATIALTTKLQDAATAGGQPPVLISVDQEGGSIKRIVGAPPSMSPPQIGATGDPDVAQAQGEDTGTALAALGINVDLAPVADVPGSKASFMYKDGRTFSFDAERTAELADAFATGLESNGVLATMKHFPGIGLATRNTDSSVVMISATIDELDPGLSPYRTAILSDIPLIMLSNATYSAYDPDNAAGWSPAIVQALLREQLGFTGVTITDSLDGTAHARGISTKSLALRAAIAGTDMILVTGSESTSRAVYATLLAAAEAGTLPADTLQASYDRIIALKSGL